MILFPADPRPTPDSEDLEFAAMADRVPACPRCAASRPEQCRECQAATRDPPEGRAET